MQSTVRKFTEEQRFAVVAGCANSGLTIREYAALNNVSLSALDKWSKKSGIALRERPGSGQCSQIDPLRKREPMAKTKRPDQDPAPHPKVAEPTIETGNAIDANASGSMNGSMGQGFSFVDITNYAKPQASLETPLGGLEIRMPNGVQLKVDHIPFESLWQQVAWVAKTLGGI